MVYETIFLPLKYGGISQSLPLWGRWTRRKMLALFRRGRMRSSPSPHSAGSTGFEPVGRFHGQWISNPPQSSPLPTSHNAGLSRLPVDFHDAAPLIRSLNALAAYRQAPMDADRSLCRTAIHHAAQAHGPKVASSDEEAGSGGRTRTGDLLLMRQTC